MHSFAACPLLALVVAFALPMSLPAAARADDTADAKATTTTTTATESAGTTATESAATTATESAATTATERAVTTMDPVTTSAPAAPPPTTTQAATTTTEPVVVAVLDLKAAAGAEAQGQALTTMLTAEVAGLAGKRAISRNELKALWSHQADAQLAGCAEVQCMADVAHLVNANMILSGDVQRLNGATALGLTLFDVAGGDARVVGRQEAAWRGSDQDLLLLARPLVQRLFDAEHAASHTGRIELLAPEGALVVVDGKEVGTAPLPTSLDGLATGAHRIGLRKDGFAPLDLDVVVARGETTVARGELVEIPWTDQPWFWWTAGGVVLVAGGAAAGVTALAFLNQPTTVVVGKP
jgi:hypothetical protein